MKNSPSVWVSGDLHKQRAETKGFSQLGGFPSCQPPRNPVQRVLIETIRKSFPKAPLRTWAHSDVGWDTLAFRGRLQGGFNLMLALTLGKISQVG